MPDVRVLVAADEALARAGLTALLTSQPGCSVVGQTALASAQLLSAAVEAYRPDVLLADLGWNPAPAIERLSGFHGAGLPIAVLLPDTEGSTGSAAAAASVSAADWTAAAWAAGARSLLSRAADGPRLAAALIAATHGLAVLDAPFASALAAAIEPARRPDLPAGEDSLHAEELTPREREVLRLLAEGLSNKAIAHSLRISEHTVKFHVNAILGKLGVQSRTEAVVRATRLGLIFL